MELKRVSVIGLCLAAVAAVVMLAAVIIRPPKIYISEICPSNSGTSKKTAMQDKNGELQTNHTQTQQKNIGQKLRPIQC